MFVLAPGVSFCVVDDVAMFLDIRRDRYFALSPEQTQGFLALASNVAPLTLARPATAGFFLDHQILVPSPVATDIRACRALPVRGERLGPRSPARFHVRYALLAGLSIAMALIRLQIQPFARIVEGQSRPTAGAPRSRVLPEDALATFLTMVRICPVRLECLPFAIALRAFLKALRIECTLVLGVKRLPFAAHCWVQMGDRVIGDSLDQVGAFTAIRIVL